jgi:hypothetical protein
MRRLAESLMNASEQAARTLMIASKPTPTDNPGQAAFDDPSPGKDGQGWCGTWLLFVPRRLLDGCLAFGSDQSPHDLDLPTQMLLHPCDECAPIMALSPQQSDPAKEIFRWLKHAPGSPLIRGIGSRDFDCQEVALRIDEQMAFASPDFFSPYRSPSQDLERHWF